MMRKYISILILMCVSTCMMAQSELKINDIFEGKAFKLKDTEESCMMGDVLKNYKLTILRTLKFTAQDKERNETERLFKIDIKDINKQNDDNMEMEIRNGHIYYSIAQLSDYKGEHRFICYQCKKVGEDYKITLAYMRGKATMNELRKMFKK